MQQTQQQQGLFSNEEPGKRGKKGAAAAAAKPAKTPKTPKAAAKPKKEPAKAKKEPAKGKEAAKDLKPKRSPRKRTAKSKAPTDLSDEDDDFPLAEMIAATEAAS